jgi:regulator of protease activity HflC (stomatin/prohibitin superfamily)
MKMKKTFATLALLLTICTAGCRKPYDTPEYESAEPDETVFVIPLEGDTADQAKFASEAYLESNKVGAKKIQITHRWMQTDRWEHEGKWVPNVRVIKVKRSPVTRLWTKESAKGTAVSDQAVYVESRDSINFSVGWTITATIAEKDTAKFLYNYPAGSIALVLDSEVLGRIQKICQNVASQYDMDVCRTKKAEFQKAVEAELPAYYKNFGITILNVGMYGGFDYANVKIQEAIDQAAAAQNLKVVEGAKFEAQQKQNETLALAAQGKAEAARNEAKGLADAKFIAAEADQKVADMWAKNPSLTQLRMLDLQRSYIEKWDGRLPVWQMGGDSKTPNLMLNLPTTAPSK